MPAGRPTKYTPALVKRAQEYVDLERKEDAEDPKAFREAIPSAVGLASYLGINQSTMYRWGDEEGKEEFKEILDAIQRDQQQILLNSGLLGRFNPAITKLVLGKHGYHEKTESESTLKIYAKEVEDMSDADIEAELERGA